jgi:tape measure domain-containing protein
MAKHKVSDFYVEIGFDDRKAMQGLEKFENQVEKSAVRIKKMLADAMKLPSVKGSGLPFGNAPRPTGTPPKPRPSTDPITRRNLNIDTAVANQMYSGFSRQMEKHFGSRYTDANLREPLQKLANEFKANSNKTYADFRKEMNKLVDVLKKDVQTRKDDLRSKRKGEWLQDRSASSFKQMIGTAVTSFAIADQISQAVSVGMERQRREIAAQSVYGNRTAEAEANARRLAMTYGQGYNETLRQQTSFAAGAMPSMGYQGSQKFFEQAMQFATVRGLGKDEMQGVMRAFEQMASKGKIQAEELRGQLGDRMAGAFQMFAAAMGVTTQELDNMMKKGEVLSDKVLPKVGDRMEQLAKENGGLTKALDSTQVAVGQFSYALEEARDSFWKNDFKKGYTDLTQAVTQFLLTHREVFQDIGDMFGDLMTMLADFVGYTDEKLAHLRGYWGKFLDYVYLNVNSTAAEFLDENTGWLLFFTILSGRIMSIIGLFTKFRAVAVGAAEAAATATAAVGGAASVGLSKMAPIQVALGSYLGETVGQKITDTDTWSSFRNMFQGSDLFKEMSTGMKLYSGQMTADQLKTAQENPAQFQQDYLMNNTQIAKGLQPAPSTPFDFWKDDQMRNFGTFAQGGFSNPPMNMTTHVKVVTPDGKQIAEQVVQEQVPLMIDKHNEMQVNVAAPFNDF